MKIKKLICGILAAGMMCAAAPYSFAEDEILVMVDNAQVEFDQPPAIIDGRTLVPIRAVFEKAGATVEWDQATQTATIQNDNNIVQISPYKDMIYKNGKAIGLDVPAQNINDRILIPVRAISDALDFGVTWNGYKKIVLIATDGRPYRAFSESKRGFRDLPAISDFYVNGSCVNNIADLNGDGISEKITFTDAMDVQSAEMPLLSINDINFSSELEKDFSSLDALAVISLDGETKQVVITGNGDIKTAQFYTYDGISLTKIGDRGVEFKTRLLFDENSYILSDLHGLCFTDIIVTGSFYKYENDNFKYYKLTNADGIIPRVLIHTYNDNMLFTKIQTDEYKEGTYGNQIISEQISSEALSQFTLLDMYVDPKAPEYVEFYIEEPNGERSVIMPYRS